MSENEIVAIYFKVGANIHVDRKRKNHSMSDSIPMPELYII